MATAMNNNGNQYGKDFWDWFFVTIVEAGIPPTGKLALEMVKEKTGRTISKSSIHYHVNPTGKQRVRERTQKYRANSPIVIIGQRLDGWRNKPSRADENTYERPVSKSYGIVNEGRTPYGGFSRKLNRGIIAFSVKGTENKGSNKMIHQNFSSQEALDHLAKTQNLKIVKDEKGVATEFSCDCAISGLPIDLFNDKWHIDHKNPANGNTLENFSIATKEYNQMKSDKTYEELEEMCITFLKNRGYQV
tara:strand:- start:351 stop:1091 length:741 start_codon:yes stop_codon:yes gene_type:complete